MARRVAWLLVAVLLAPGLAEDLRGQPRATDELIRYYQARLARRPDDVRSYVALGQTYILKARETGDPQYYDLADQALTRCLERAPDRVTAARAATDLAVVQMARHQFREALATARRALADDSAQLNAYGIAGDAHIELGEYEQAEAAYEKMKGLPGPLYPHSRLSTLRFLRGDMAGAIGEMRRAVGAASASLGNQPKENVAWAQFKLGAMLFHTGDLEAAGQAHQDALVTYPGYHRALAGLGQVRAGQGRYSEAIELYRKAIAVIPLPDYAASAGDVYARIGRAQEAAKQYALAEYIGLLSALNKVLYNGSLPSFTSTTT
jgi:tetratricopeptide (TPR) repeat protein